MWIEKTPQEIEGAPRRDTNRSQSEVRWTICIVLGVFLMMPVFFNVGRLTWRPGPFVRSMDDVMQRLPVMVFIYLIAIIPMWVLKVPILKKKKVMICPECEAAKNDDGDYMCPCGGRFVDIKSMKWVE
jgi:hypothetical protein